MHLHFLPVEDPPTLGVTAVGLGALAGKPFYVHLTLYLQRELQLDIRLVSGLWLMGEIRYCADAINDKDTTSRDNLSFAVFLEDKLGKMSP